MPLLCMGFGRSLLLGLFQLHQYYKSTDEEYEEDGGYYQHID